VNAAAPLLDQVCGLLERTYRMRSGLPDLAPFLIGDRGLRQLLGESGVARATVGSPGGPRALFRETPHGLRASIYFPDALIRCLERYPPQHGLGTENVEAFAAFVEEIDHLLLVAERVRLQRPVSLLELELHANVSKHLVLTRFLAGDAAWLAPARRLWLRHQLFGCGRYSEPDRAVCRRYEEAARGAVRFLDGIVRLTPAARLERLRRFHAVGLAGKLRLAEGRAA